jgi:hypothetical protein
VGQHWEEHVVLSVRPVPMPADRVVRRAEANWPARSQAGSSSEGRLSLKILPVAAGAGKGKTAETCGFSGVRSGLLFYVSRGAVVRAVSPLAA